VLALPRGQRRSRVIVDGQKKGTDAIDAVCHLKQAEFLQRMGLYLMILPPGSVHN
jgi:hypothetical protein